MNLKDGEFSNQQPNKLTYFQFTEMLTQSHLLLRIPKNNNKIKIDL